MSAFGKIRSSFRHHKRARIAPEPEEVVDELSKELEDLRLFADSCTKPIWSPSSFDMQSNGDKERLAIDLWKGSGIDAELLALREANPVLVQVLEAAVANEHDRRSSEEQKAKKQRLVDGTLLNIVRAHNQHTVTRISAGISILARGGQLPREIGDAVRAFFPGALCSENWVVGFLKLARDLRPLPENSLEGVAIGCFDNLSMKLNWGSYMVAGESGEFKNMTNWFHVRPPRHLAPPSFDARQLFMGGIFRTDVSLAEFCRLFYLDSKDVAQGRRNRWGKYIRDVQNGQHMHRPNVPPKWQPYITYCKPIFDRLQSSYADVQFEMNKMRQEFPHLKILFLAGDGLALMRVNWLLALHPDIYLDQSPCIIPIQGEHPHGLFHGLHCQWRLFRPFIMKCAEVCGNTQVKRDPTVSDLNVSRFFLLNIITPAACEYIVELCSGDPAAESWDDPVPFMAKAAKNVNFDWLCHFLHDCAFWVLDFLQSVRANDSHNLDVLWREFFASAHSDTAHKTQYVGMSIMRVFWGMAMKPDLSEFYHNIRTLPSGTHMGSGVGYDMKVENLNGAIKSHVDMHVSETQIENFIDDWALLETVQSSMRGLIYVNRAEKHWRGRDVRADIETLKAHFRTSIGTTYAQAMRPTTALRVTSGAERQTKPWVEVAAVMSRRGNAAPHAYISSYVTQLSGFFPWKL